MIHLIFECCLKKNNKHSKKNRPEENYKKIRKQHKKLKRYKPKNLNKLLRFKKRSKRINNLSR